jgi:prephenate dehydrogenase
MYQALNMRLIYMGAAEHDLHAAYVSHLSHISSFVLANTILAKEKDVNTIFDLASGGFESTVRLAKSSPLMWTPIFEENQ